MRTLVDQTATNVRRWIEALELANRLGVHVLMGGEGVDDWDLYPQREAILIGTQDMLLSHALNRRSGLPLVKLDENDLSNCDVRQRREAVKPLQPATAPMDDSSRLAAEILEAHQRARAPCRT